MGMKIFITHIVKLSRKSKAGSRAGLKIAQEKVGGMIDLKFHVVFGWCWNKGFLTHAGSWVVQSCLKRQRRKHPDFLISLPKCEPEDEREAV